MDMGAGGRRRSWSRLTTRTLVMPVLPTWEGEEVCCNLLVFRVANYLQSAGEINVGQRCRELFGSDNVFNVGFLTNRGTGEYIVVDLGLKLIRNLSVTASYEWDDPPHIHRMNPAFQGSIENVFDEWAKGDSFVITHQIEATPDGKTKKKEVAAELSE